MNIQDNALEDLFRAIPDSHINLLFRNEGNLEIKHSLHSMIKKLPGLENTDIGIEIYTYGKNIYKKIRETTEDRIKLEIILDMVNYIETNYDLYQGIKKEKFMEMKVFDSSEGNVWKYVFTDENIVLESVLYKYNSFEERTVICCSVQSGCPVGCQFCGTGANFLKNIDADTIVYQIAQVLKDKGIEDINSRCEKFQIMFMSMGEPFLNFDNVKEAIIRLNRLYPNAQLLVSTIGVKDDKVFKDFIDLSVRIDKIGLQFSIHKSNDEERDILIPYKKKYNLREIRDRAIAWRIATGRQVYFNYCVDESNAREEDIENLKNLFSPVFSNFTFSVICEADETMKDKACQNINVIRAFEQSFMDDGYNTRIFNPAGQDDIGGGCGQLFKVQDFLKNKNKKEV